MSDLAPFVAAALRDKVVSDMEEEIRGLQKRLRHSQTVEIVCDNDEEETVYYSSLLENGKHANRCQQLEMRLTKNEETSSGSCPLSKLSHLSVRIGGLHKADLRKIAHNGYMEDDFRDGDDCKHMTFEGAGVKLEFEIHRWPREQWAPLVEIGHILMGDNLLQNLLQASQFCPEATLIFRSIALRTQGLKGILQNLPEPARSKFQKEQQQEKKRRQYKNYIIERMREVGYQNQLVIGSSEIMELLQDLKVSSATTQRDRDLIVEVVRLHREAQNAPNSDEAFFSIVPRITERLREEGEKMSVES